MGASPLNLRPEAIVQLLDEQHLVIVGDETRRRSLAQTLARHAEAMPQTRVAVLSGRDLTGADLFARDLASRFGLFAASPAAELDVVDVLRAMPPTQRQYVIWHDADAMLTANPLEFGRVVNAAIGVAAEREHLSRDDLIIERWIFLGGESLADYAADARGQMRAWLDEDGATPFWDVATVVERPRVLTVRLE